MTQASESTFDEMKRYVRFGDADVRALAAFGAHAGPMFERIAEEFYDRTREHDAAHAVFQDEAQIMRLRASLVRWMRRMVGGPHDASYYAESEKIGRVHVRVGLPQRYVFTAMSFLRQRFEDILDAWDPALASAARRALARILDLEMAIMSETYREDSLERLQHVEALERDRLEKALERTEHRYANAVELARVLVVGMDTAGRIQMFNAEAERTTGFARDEAIGRPFAETLVPEEFRDDWNLHLPGTPGANESWEAPVRTRSGRARTIAWHLSYAPIEIAGDTDVVHFAIGVDVTEQNALRERTLLSERLASVGTLAAGLAHEIRNPLNGALLQLTFLERELRRDGRHEPEALAAARTVGDEIRRLSALVRDFLVFARPSPLTVARASLRDVCERAIAVIRADALAGHATIVTDYGTTDLQFPMDGAKIEQALLNLLRNAIEAVAAAGGGDVTLRTRRSPRKAVVEVEDTGTGLTTSDAPIFDAFFSTKPSGTGLGLSIVHRVVTDHGGTVEVSSRPRCTRFTITLPLEGPPNTESS